MSAGIGAGFLGGPARPIQSCGTTSVKPIGSKKRRPRCGGKPFVFNSVFPGPRGTPREGWNRMENSGDGSVRGQARNVQAVVEREGRVEITLDGVRQGQTTPLKAVT